MKKRRKIYYSTIIFTILVVCIMGNTYAHSGRTDAYGGHKDNKNKSGLGSYHYHCGGHPAHLHTNGVCPYATSSNISNKTTKNKETTKQDNNKSNVETKKKENIVIVAESIKINEDILEMQVNEEQQLTATINPNNVADKTIKWTTSDETIASVNSNGMVLANKAGIVNITASTSNAKKDTLRIVVKENEKKIVEENKDDNNEIKNNVENIIENNVENDGNIAGTIGSVATIGGISYLVYKKAKKQ